LPDGQLIPAVIADAGDQAAWRYVEYPRPNTRRACGRACQTLFAECDEGAKLWLIERRRPGAQAGDRSLVAPRRV
jgi:hypothetical protein